MDTAKHVGMMSKTNKGKQIRSYFIKCEKEAHNPNLSVEQRKKELAYKLLIGGIDSVQAHKELIKIETKTLIETIEVQKPKVEYHDNVLNSTNLLTVTDIAKDLGMSARKLNKILHDNKIIYPKFKKKFDKNKNEFKDIISHWIPYSDYEFLISESYADYKISSFGACNNNIGSNQQLCFTEKGIKWIIELLSNLKINS